MGSSRDYPDFDSFVVARQQALLRAAYLMVGDAGLAEDLVQEALVKTYAAWPRVRARGNPEAYVRRAITTTALSWFRRKRWYGERPTGVVPEQQLGDHAGRVTDGAWLAARLDELPPRQRIAVVLRFYEDLTEAQTAEVMGCAVGTVKSQVSAALTKLRVSTLPDLSDHLDPAVTP